MRCNIAELLLKARSLKGLETPSDRDYRSVLHFMENDGGQVYEEESGWIYDKEDLITLRPGREYAWLDGFLERILKACRCGLLTVGCRLYDARWAKEKTRANCLLQYLFCSKVRSRTPRY